MRLLPIVHRELVSAARRPATFRIRMAGALLAVLVYAFVLLAIAQSLPAANQGPTLFLSLATLAFYYCLFSGAYATADCISQEKRESTLGLLFLTDLRGYDVVLGKLVASSLNCVYGLIATLPVLATAILLGGLSASHAAKTLVVLLNTLFLSLSAGIFISCFSHSERKAMFGTLCFMLGLTFGPYAIANFHAYNPDQNSFMSFDSAFLTPSPLHAFELSSATGAARNVFFPVYLRSIGVGQLLAWSLLITSSVLLPRVCHDRPQGPTRARWSERFQQWAYGAHSTRHAFRRRLLNRNPILWLMGRDRLKADMVWLFLGGLIVVWAWGYWKFRELIFDWVTSAWLLLIVHGALKVWFTTEVCSRLAEDRKSGALELLFSTPLRDSDFAQGQTLALSRQFAGPAAVLLVLELMLLTRGLREFSYNASTEGVTLVFIAIMAVLVIDLWALRWVGAWMALKASSLNRAILATALRVLVLPWAIYLCLQAATTAWQYLVMFLGVQMAPGLWSLARSQNGVTVSLAFLACCWFGIGLSVALGFGWWARIQFFAHCRTLAAQRFDADAISGPPTLSDKQKSPAIAAATNRQSTLPA